MTKENQAVTSELTRLGAERDDGRRKLGDALHAQATAEQVRTLLQQFCATSTSFSATIAHQCSLSLGPNIYLRILCRRF